LKGDYGSKQVVKNGNTVFVESRIGYTENEFFEIFDFPILHGNKNEPIAKGLSVVLTESTAKKYFGNENAIGKIVSFKDTSFHVSAVMKDFPANSSLQFDLLFSMDIVKLKFRGSGEWKTIDQDWGNYNYSTFCLVKEGANTKVASDLILKEIKKANPDASVVEFPFRPLNNLYLYKPDGSKGRLVLVEIFFIVAIFVLLIAAINYINLVTARATQRIKEISIRKIIGADKKQLFWQFFIETGVLLLLSAVFAFVLIQFFLPVYREVSNTSIELNPSNKQMWQVVLWVLAGIWLLTGFYPALLLSSFKPLQSLRGRGFMSNAGLLRKALVVLQFVVSLTLLLSTIFIHKQMDYLQNRDMNVNTENKLVIDVWKIWEQTSEFKNRLTQIPGIRDMTSASAFLFGGVNSTTDIEWPGKPKDEKMWISVFEVDKNFIEFFKTPMKEGMGFENVAPGAPSYILNETAVRKMGLKDPVGQSIKFHNEPGTVIGVVSDFNYESLHKDLEPALIQYNPNETGIIYATVLPSDAKKVISDIEKIWKEYEPNLPMEYKFLDEQLATQYDKENRAKTLFDAFSIITLLISCLGLFGLATHSAERRVKEIGIRKVLGANVRNIAALLSKEFVVLVLLAIFISVPLVYLGMQKLLQEFAYKISLDWWVFAIAGLCAMFIALATVSLQAVKAAFVNPVKSLRSE
ncbi:MAG: FtsX-like permease family protein, partial [Flavisolibacter sp.]